MFGMLKKYLLRRPDNSRTFYALKNISLNISRGEKIGIVGNNGSGKSTLLRLVAGLYKPSKGKIYTNGKTVFLAGWGIGMIDELSVEENIFLYGTIYGMDKKKLRENFYDIIEWAELQDFVGAKLKTLSTGMRTRLAFSTMRYIQTDILLLDEALSAGDKRFKKKCANVFANYKNSARIFLVASHDQSFVETFCNKTLWLHKGEQRAFGETARILKQYNTANGW